MNHAARIIDANANRAREAMRVLEDAARFLLGSRALSESLKTIRHELAATLDHMPGGEGVGLAHRDTPNDVGTSIAAPGEYQRQGAREVVLAAGKRLTEALRSIEEYAKALPELASKAPNSTDLSPEDFAKSVEQLRYRAYGVERRLLLALGTGRGTQWRLCVLITEKLCTAGHSWLDVAIAAAQNGADCIQLREHELSDKELTARAIRLVETVKPLGPSIVINNRPDIAVIAHADAVHLGQNDMPIHQARKITGFELLIGHSTNNLREAQHALRDGADYCGVGPMFASPTKTKPVAGPMYLMEYLKNDPPLPPHLAIGGITPDNVVEVVAAGAKGVAGSSAICGEKDPGEAARAIREVIDRYAAVSPDT
jgi:thiamine-phosphate pyrophosphorylase